MIARRLALAGLLAAPVAAAARAPRGVWFDPTQLPSYSGRLERWLLNPAGETDRALLREGVQIVFAPSEAPDLMAAVEPGQNLTAWGIRARAAPVVTMLAWARASDQPAIFVNTPAWFASHATGRQELRLEGEVRHHLLTPQGEPMGVVLADGDVVRVSVAAHAALGEALAVRRRLFAEGLGARVGERAALDAARLGNAPDALAPVPAAP